MLTSLYMSWLLFLYRVLPSVVNWLPTWLQLKLPWKAYMSFGIKICCPCHYSCYLKFVSIVLLTVINTCCFGLLDLNADLQTLICHLIFISINLLNTKKKSFIMEVVFVGNSARMIFHVFNVHICWKFGCMDIQNSICLWTEVVDVLSHISITFSISNFFLENARELHFVKKREIFRSTKEGSRNTSHQEHVPTSLAHKWGPTNKPTETNSLPG